MAAEFFDLLLDFQRGFLRLCRSVNNRRLLNVLFLSCKAHQSVRILIELRILEGEIHHHNLTLSGTMWTLTQKMRSNGSMTFQVTWNMNIMRQWPLWWCHSTFKVSPRHLWCSNEASMVLHALYTSHALGMEQKSQRQTLQTMESESEPKICAPYETQLLGSINPTQRAMIVFALNEGTVSACIACQQYKRW